MVLFISLFHDYKLPSLRIYAAVFHFVATFFLTWTRIDSLNAAIPDVTYMTQESSYLGYIATGIIFIFFNFVVLLFKGFQDKSLSGVMQLFLDICGTFFCLWISLDGLDWNTYINVWLFCAFFPFLYNMTTIVIKTYARTSVAWSRNAPNPVRRWFRNAYADMQEFIEAIQSLQ